MSQHERNLEQLIQSIRARRATLDAQAQRLRTPELLSAFKKWDSDSWCRAIAGDAIVKIRIFTEQNFNFVETMSIIAVARYLFELGVWLRLCKNDRRYGLVYFGQLLETQLRFFQDTEAQLHREIALLAELGRRELEERDKVLQKIRDSAPGNEQAHAAELKAISDRIDAEAARRFSIYAGDARTNGYRFQAHLVKTKAVPQVQRAIEGITNEKSSFDATVSNDIKALIPKKWNWRQMALKVGKSDEYDYIYSFASKLLHATPASITTDEKNLEDGEMEVFLKYIEVTIDDVIAIAGEYLPDGPPP